MTPASPRVLGRWQPEVERYLTTLDRAAPVLAYTCERVKLVTEGGVAFFPLPEERVPAP